MTKEFRRITFSNRTLRKAIGCLGAGSGDPFPAGDIVSIKSVKKGSDDLFELEFFDYAKKKNAASHIPGAEAAEALIQFCIANHIPIPRSATKTARVVDGYICLDIFMGVEDDSNFANHS